LEARLEDSEETLGAIRRGEIDALVIGDVATAHQVYTLENADRPYRMLIEQIQVGAVTLSADGTVLYCNQRLAEMFGTLQEQVIGHKVQPHITAAPAASSPSAIRTGWSAPQPPTPPTTNAYQIRSQISDERRIGEPCPVLRTQLLLRSAEQDGQSLLVFH
jgi:PAS domain-containing protein